MIEITGTERLNAVLRAAPARAVAGLSAALFREGNEIMSASRELVPVDEGTLRGSGTVMAPQASVSGVEVEFGYGGAASDYAVVQHERMDFRHASGGPKFLESPTLEAANGMGARLARTVRQFLERR